MLKNDEDGKEMKYSGRESELKDVTHGFIFDLVEVATNALLFLQIHLHRKWLVLLAFDTACMLCAMASTAAIMKMAHGMA